MATRILFFFVVAIILGSYVGLKLGGLSTRYRRWLIASSFVFVTVAATAPMAARIPFPGWAWASGMALGWVATFVILLLPFDLALRAWLLGNRLRKIGPLRPERREFLLRSPVAGFLGASAGFAGIGLGQAMHGPALKRVSVPVNGLHPDLVGLRIVQISDLHVGPLIRGEYVENVIRMVRELKPDLIAVTGDLVDGTVPYLSKWVEPLKELHAPLGTYYVTGNHEYFWGASDWMEHVKTLGFKVLSNRGALVPVRQARLWIGGVNDPMAQRVSASQRPDSTRAAAGSEGADFRLLLSHRPDECDAAEPAGFDLQLSGHTHAGQFFPFSLLIPLVHRYYRGLYRHKRMWLYVNVGTGFWGPPNRFGNPAELTELTLVQA